MSHHLRGLGLCSRLMRSFSLPASLMCLFWISLDDAHRVDRRLGLEGDVDHARRGIHLLPRHRAGSARRRCTTSIRVQWRRPAVEPERDPSSKLARSVPRRLGRGQLRWQNDRRRVHAAASSRWSGSVAGQRRLIVARGDRQGRQAGPASLAARGCSPPRTVCWSILL